MDKKYVSTKTAKKILGVHLQTLYNWEKKGLIETMRTPGGHRLYNIEKYMKEHNNNKTKSNTKINRDSDKDSDEDNDTDKDEITKHKNHNKKEKRLKICYVRVSTLGQKGDLERQKEYMRKRYPKHEIIEDIGSGINLNRRGLRRIIKYGIEGRVEELVIAYKDRLTRFGYELIEDIIKEYSDGKIIIDDKKNNKKDAKEELIEDVLQIMNVYTAKMNGLRKYKKI